MTTASRTLELENLGSLITIKGTNHCLGYLMAFDGRGIYCPEYGKVDHLGVTREYADAHNKALDEAMLNGLDENCEIGQHGTFYLVETKEKICGIDAKGFKITTFCGTLVSNEVSFTRTKRFNKSLGTYSILVTFRRNGKHYRGTNNGFDQLLNFKRIK